MSDSEALQRLPDYSSLCQVREALWGQNEVRGAAIMVGAGFSRCAKRVSESSPLPPLWSTFEKAMLERLYPGEQKSYDPLKLAEEYKAALGTHALDALIRQLVTDGQWLPGDLHTRLLSLPWADILTTNWDTLLERTALPNPDRSYDVVHTVHDIARTRAPRIVKLHGSLPSHQPFIFTAEDFRTYPRNYAAFINLAQQVLLENDLCLIGFSGDDPNFLQWAGWVRDQLGSNARRIRLVGALNLSVSQRQVLEQRNVSPIDLAPLVQGLEPNEAHKKASQIFLDALWAGKPKPLHEWIRTPVPHQAPTELSSDDLIGRLVASWEGDRKGYPGWLVAPSHHRTKLRFETDHWFSEMRKALPNASAPFRAKAISELSWRYEIAFWTLDDFMYDLFSSSVSAGELDNLPKSDRIRVYAVLLTQARHDRKWDDFEKWLTLLQSFDGAEVIAICRYQQALKAKAEFDFPKLAELAPFLKGDDPVWYLRQASLYCILREYQKAAEIIREAKILIHTRRSREKNSIWLLSREGWASWLFKSARYELEDEQRSIDDDAWPNNYHAAGCDPWDYIHAIDSEISKQWEERAKEAVVIEASFDAGSYRDHSKTVRFRNGADVLVIDEVIRMSEHVGLPDRIGTMGVMGTKIQRAIQVIPQMSKQHVSLAATHITNHSKGLIDHVFGRVDIARLPHTVANELVATLRLAIDFALQQIVKGNSEWIDTARVYLELLSRLMISQSEDVAKETFLWGMELSKHPGLSHWWLSEPLSHLLCRSLEAVPPASRGELSYEALSLPLPRERSIAGLAREWPELCDEFDSRDFRNRGSDFKWNSRISELIEAVRTGDTLNRTRALLRLSLLAEETMLSVEEQSRLAVAIWDKRASENGLPANSELYPHVYLFFPEPSEGLSASMFNEVIVKPLAAGEIDELRLVGLQGSSGERCKDRFALSPQDALAIFDKCIGWRPSAPKNRDFLGTARDTSQAISKAVGSCLAWAVLPALTSGLLDDALLTRWRDAITEANVPSFLLTAAHLVRLFPSEREWVTKTLRKALAARDEATVVAALNTTVQFVHLHKKEGIEIPSILSADIASMCAVRREPGLLYSIAVARRLLMADLLTCH